MRKAQKIRGIIATVVILAVFGGGIYLGSVFTSGSSGLFGTRSGDSSQTRGPDDPSSPAGGTTNAPPSRLSVDPETMNAAVVALQDAFHSVAQQAMPVVVEINTVDVVERRDPQLRSPFDFFFGQPDQGEEQQFERPGLGSGVIVRKDGNTVYVLTNNHVVGDADEISVGLFDGSEFEAEIVGTDDRTDLAMVSFRTDQDVPVAELGDSEALRVGDWVVAIGNPFGFESTVTAGIVSALGRRPDRAMSVANFTDYIQTDAAINPGNSGGALLNLNGKVVGINTWIASQSGGSAGLGFAIPINNAKRAIDSFIDEGKIGYGWLGVSITDTDVEPFDRVAEELGIGDRTGALVTNVYEDAPAAAAGIAPGDVVVAFNDQAVSNADDLTRLVGTAEPGSRNDFTVVRAGEEITLTVRLTERAPEEELTSNRNLWPGMYIVPLDDETRDQLDISPGVQGVVVAQVLEGTPAAVAGLRSGDVVFSLNDETVRTTGDFYQELREVKPGDEAEFRVNRDGVNVLTGVQRAR